jgi:hypothetical protein
MDSGVTSVDVGAGLICAVKSGGLYCWGRNFRGEQGVDTGGAPVLNPSVIAGLEAGVTAVSAGGISLVSSFGGAAICAIQSGALVCLGANDLNQLGNGNSAFVSAATAHPSLTAGVTSVAMSGLGGCAVVSGGVRCWGGFVNPATGVVALNGVNSSDSPVPVVGLPAGTWLSVHGNGGAFCARNAALQEYCWGFNLNRALFADVNVEFATVPLEAGPFEY